MLRIQRLPADDLRDASRRHQQMAELFRDFQEAALNHGRIIIAEYFLPHELKTLKPANMGGIAGGEKYLFGNILFKFSLDLPLSCAGGETRHMYGGEHGPLHRLAIKAAGAEFRNLCHFVDVAAQHRIDLVHPLMTLVDFAGFRLVCVSLLPISDRTLAYGSADAGASFRHCDLFLAEKIDQACRLLNLKPHRAIGGASSIASPCDLEGHVGLDGSHVVLDFGRLFPPHAVLERPHPLLGKQVFYRFFRPEFVRRHPQPLCADAYSGWLASDPDAAVHNAEVLAATKQLLAEALPAQAAALDAQAQQQQQQQQRQQQQQHNMPQGAVLVAALHAEGINLRHLGLLAGLVSRPAAKTAVLLELVARGLKNVLNGLLRQPQVVSLTHRHHALLAFLNSFFNPRSALWTADLPQELQLHFGLDVSALSLPGFSPPPELFYGAPLFHFLPLSALCARWLCSTG